MIVDGRQLAKEIVDDIKSKTQEVKPRLVVFTCAPNFETQKFLQIKQKQASLAGVLLEVIHLPADINLDDVSDKIKTISADFDAVVVQFPFPHLATEDVIPLIPVDKDVDVFSFNGQNEMFPPVIGAIDYIANHQAFVWTDKRVVVVGCGRLVGRPAMAYLSQMGIETELLTKDNFNPDTIHAADVLILGAGVPGLVTPEMVKEGAVVFDAGASEEGGVLVGDADPRVADKASLFTPVPGGIGPVAVAILLRNVLYLANRHRTEDKNVV